MLVYIIYRQSFHNGALGTSRRFQPLCKALNAQSSPVTLGIDQLTPRCEQLVVLD